MLKVKFFCSFLIILCLKTSYLFSQTQTDCGEDGTPRSRYDKMKEDIKAIDEFKFYEHEAFEAHKRNELKDAIYYLEKAINKLETICPELLMRPDIKKVYFSDLNILSGIKMDVGYSCRVWLKEQEKMIKMGYDLPSFVDRYEKLKKLCENGEIN
ncbi:MAG: hypothetical protein MUE85_16120 [Microscillaceae bacterium]|jgi:hypothetical protein|nr:hypothetical protein [Microscillaceae bacterium]